MADDAIGAAGVGKSVRSLLDALTSLEKEVEYVFERVGQSAPGSAASLAGLSGLASKVFPGLASLPVQGLSLARLLSGFGSRSENSIESSLFAVGLSRALGLADAGAVAELRQHVSELVDQVSRLREREIALAGGVSQLRARTARFDEALVGLARVQGRCAARLSDSVERTRRVEQLAGRRDDHITRLIRDNASQRADLERLTRDIPEAVAKAGRQAKEEAVGAGQIDQLNTRVDAAEKRFADLRKLQKNGTSNVIETLESMRDRVARLEARATEMSREARAKTGRLDALARHVATVEGRLSSALGQGGKPVVAAAAALDVKEHQMHPVAPVALEG